MSETAELELKDFLQELNVRELSNSQERDKAVISLSSAGFAISLTMLKLFTNPSALPLLQATWILFVLSIISTLTSFHTSQAGLDQVRKVVEGLKEKETVPWRDWTRWLNFLSSFAFGAALVTLTFFAILNI